MQSLRDHHVAVIASSNVMPFLLNLLQSIEQNKIKLRQLVIGDAGLSPLDRSMLMARVRHTPLQSKLELVELPLRDEGVGFKTQSESYRKVINNRVSFLRGLFLRDDVDHVLQLDADTELLSNDFSELDLSCDATLTMRRVSPGGHVSGIWSDAYPNCGVIFWNDPWACLEVLDVWDGLRKSLPPHSGQYEQNAFVQMMKTEAWGRLTVQELPCRTFNCYHPFWRDGDERIVHLKGTGIDTSFAARKARMDTPNTELPTKSGFLIMEDASMEAAFELERLIGGESSLHDGISSAVGGSYVLQEHGRLHVFADSFYADKLRRAILDHKAGKVTAYNLMNEAQPWAVVDHEEGCFWTCGGFVTLKAHNGRPMIVDSADTALWVAQPGFQQAAGPTKVWFDRKQGRQKEQI